MHTAIELGRPTTLESPEDCDARFVDTVIDILRARTGCDFSGYRRPTLERRIANRMLAVGCRNPRHYRELLASPGPEPQRLLERITIKVSRFYRHAPTFDFLREEVLPGLACARGTAALRLWSIGCGAGEEAYTLAMLLEEARIPGMVEASDIDASAVAGAREALYPLSAVAELPSELLDRFLEPVVVNRQPLYQVSDAVRARVQFSLHDVTAVAPPPAGGPFDLVSCRNVLIYLQRPAQVAATRRLIDQVTDAGVLCLGEAEWPPLELIEQLDPLPHRTRLFRVRPRMRR